MSIYNLILNRRSIRKFQQKPIDNKILLNCLNAARLAPSARNLQPLEYVLITKNLDVIFNHIRFGGYLEEAGPKKDEKPVAYIIIFSSTEIKMDCKYDVGLAAGNIILTALEKGVASCVIGAIEREELRDELSIPNNHKVELVIALGYPKQKSVEGIYKGNTKYYLDKKSILHIPKRALKDIVHKETYGRKK